MKNTHTSAFPPTGSLEALLAAKQRGSLSAAAEELNLTHGAISRRISSLERWLGASLFERHGRGVRLTPIGTQFARRVERSMGAIVDLAAEIRSPRSTGSVRLSVLPSIARLWLMPRLSTLQGDPCDVNLAIETEHRVANLDGRDADLAIRFGYGDWSGVESTLLFGETLVPVASPAIARQVDKAPERIADYALLHDTDTVAWRRWFRIAGLGFRLSDSDRRFDDYDLVLGAAQAGVGIALARLPLAYSAISSGALSCLPGPALEQKRAHWLVMSRDEQRAAVLRVANRIVAEANRTKSLQPHPTLKSLASL